MHNRLFAVYRLSERSPPIAVDITSFRRAGMVDTYLQTQNWYGTVAQSPADAIESFRRHEMNKTAKSDIRINQATL